MAVSGCPLSLAKTVALVGMMGAGKTAIGTRLAKRLEVPFADADHEIEQAARLSVKEIFEKYGEPHFRDGERRVIARLLGEAPHVLATGGGAYIDDTTRAALRESAFTIWLKVPLEILLGRVRKRQAQDQSRPLLNNDLRGTMEKLLTVREPVYAQADMVLESVDMPHGELVDRIVAELARNGLCETP